MMVRHSLNPSPGTTAGEPDTLHRSAVIPMRAGRPWELSLLLPLFLMSCSSELDCSAVTCVACGPAVKVVLVDQDTGMPLGPVGAFGDAEITGENGECNDSGECLVELGDDESYDFDIELDGEVIASVSTTVATTDPKGCCDCGYSTKTIEVHQEQQMDSSKQR